MKLVERSGDRLLVDRSDALCAAFDYVWVPHRFRMAAVVILPDHLHCVWTLAPGDSDLSTRWRVIKGHLSRALAERVSQSRIKRGERGLWQRRWEHLVRDEDDFIRDVDYSDWNPLKRGSVRRAGDWPHSSVHALSAARRLYFGLAWREQHKHRDRRGMTRTMRFPSFTRPCRRGQSLFAL